MEMVKLVGCVGDADNARRMESGAMKVAVQTVKAVKNTNRKSVHGMADNPRGRLLSEAAKLFRDKGYERTTVRDIAAAVGIQSGSIFHHFPSKEAILYAVIEEVIRTNTERLRLAAGNERTGTAQLRALIRQELVFIVGDTREAMSVMVQEWRCLSDEQQRAALALRGIYEQVWLDVLTVLHAEGRFTCQPFVMRRLITGMNSWAHNWFDPGRDLSLDDLTDTILARVVGEA